MKKEEVYVQTKNRIEADLFRDILEKIGQPIRPDFNTNTSLDEADLDFRDIGFLLGVASSAKQKITFGQLIDLLTEKPKIAVRVENELEFRALMEFYESKGFKSIIGTPARYFKQGRFNNGELIKIFSFEDKFICPNDYGEKPETHGLHNFKILSLHDFAKEHGLKVPLLISEDGVLLYNGDNWTGVYFNSSVWRLGCADAKLFCGSSALTDPLKTKAFSTREAAEKWIEAQNPKEKEVFVCEGIKAKASKEKVIFFHGANEFYLTAEQFIEIGEAFAGFQ